MNPVHTAEIVRQLLQDKKSIGINHDAVVGATAVKLALEWRFKELEQWYSIKFPRFVSEASNEGDCESYIVWETTTPLSYIARVYSKRDADRIVAALNA